MGKVVCSSPKVLDPVSQVVAEVTRCHPAEVITINGASWGAYAAEVKELEGNRAASYGVLMFVHNVSLKSLLEGGA